MIHRMHCTHRYDSSSVRLDAGNTSWLPDGLHSSLRRSGVREDDMDGPGWLALMGHLTG